VALVTLGCVRNEVDSEELAGRLAGAGWDLVDDPAAADVAVVNTCGFIDAAKKDSVDTLLEVADLKTGADGRARTRAVVAVGCLAERYGAELASSLPEADAVLGFDSYGDLSAILGDVLAGRAPAPHVPRDRRALLPVAPAQRQRAAAGVALPGHGQDAGPVGGPASGPPVVRARLGSAPWAPLKLASGCDRRCTFCAIPSFRGSFVSRAPDDVVAEARWLAGEGVRELFLVSENSTSYGKDLGDLRALEQLLPRLAAVEGVDLVRVSYLQPAEVRPGLLEALAGTPGVAPYFDLSFQHASPAVLRRMRRFGGTDDFLALLERVRALAPAAGVRSNVIVGFPGESEDDLAELERFLVAARLDVTGVFGYSDEEGTAAAQLDGHHDEAEVAARVERVSRLVEELTSQRAEDRVGEAVSVLVEEVDAVTGALAGRAAHQGPEVDGTTRLLPPEGAGGPARRGPAGPGVGAVVPAVVVASEGVDLVARAVGGAW
jgi:ribosomal protein S12 methylthiotransferase RimO